MIRVGMFVDSFFPMVDGVTNVVDNYAKRLNDEEFEVIVFCPKNRDKKYVDNFSYRVERCKSVKIFFLDYDLPLPRFDRRYKKVLKESKIDIVHIHSPFGVAKSGLRYAKKHKIPAIAFLHSQFKQDFYEGSKSKLITAIMLKSVMKAFNRCDEFYAVNQAIANVFLDYGAKRLPLVQRNGTDFLPVDDKEKANKLVNDTYGILPEETVFLFVGRLCKLKNVFFLCDSLVKLKDKNFKMMFVGTGQDEDALKKHIEKLGLTQNVIFTGKIMDRNLLSAIYCRAKLFLFPSLYDASSLVQVEAASQSTPTLFLKGAATASTAIENVNGFFAENSPEAYAEKIEEILHDNELYKTVSNGAFRDLYINWDDTVNIMKNIYKEMISKKN